MRPSAGTTQRLNTIHPTWRPCRLARRLFSLAFCAGTLAAIGCQMAMPKQAAEPDSETPKSAVMSPGDFDRIRKSTETRDPVDRFFSSDTARQIERNLGVN